MKIDIELTEQDVKDLIYEELTKRLGIIPKDSIEILVKSKQNYKSEWEVASFKARYLSVQ